MIINDVNSLMRWKTSDILYNLPSTFASSENAQIDTGVIIESGKQYTLTCEFSITSWSSVYGVAWGNLRANISGSYFSLRTASPRRTWGSGLLWDNGSNFCASGEHVKFLATYDDTASPKRYTKAKALTSGTVKTSTGNEGWANNNTVQLGMMGDGTGTGGGGAVKGFNGYIYQFTLYNRIFTSAEIDAYFA